MDRAKIAPRILRDVACAVFALAAALVVYRGWRHGMWIHEPRTFFDVPLLAFARAHPLPGFVRFSLPDALWQYAFGATMLAMWRGERWHWRKTTFAVAPVVLGAGIEIGQALGIVQGVFDPLDLVASVLAGIVAIALHGEIRTRAPLPS